MSSKQKLALTWINKNERPKLEPRVLVEVPELSYTQDSTGLDDTNHNLLINGDNLLALKAIELQFRGKVKCIYIDPPYNTGSAFEFYEDGIEHSLWLSLIRERIELLWKLLCEKGSLWISIDDREMPYLRVLLDEICGRSSFICQIVWQKRYSRDNNSAIGDVHEYIVVYARNPEAFKAARNLISLDDKSRKAYSNPNNDARGPWQSISFTGEGFRSNMMYPIKAPNGVVHYPPEGRHWATLEPEFLRLEAEGRIWFGRDGTGVPRLLRYLTEVGGLVPWTWWPHEDVGHTDEAKKESHGLFGREYAFSTPKPERLLRRIIEIATDPGDIVLDSFAGSGTTGAVAQKLGRSWVMVELGEHATTHIVPRMRKVIDGTDKGGITATSGWVGGGGFRFYRLAPSLLCKDRWGNWVISKDFDPVMLAEAMCKHMGFCYAPSKNHLEYWNHGFSTERDFIYVTTHALTHSMLKSLSHDVGPDRHLLICCKAFNGKTGEFANLSVRRIPQAVLATCEWGRDDYSLRVANLPKVEDADGDSEPADVHPPPKRVRQKATTGTVTDLFSEPT